VKNGATKPFPETRRLCNSLNTDNSWKLAACTVDAYVWAAKSGTFNANGAISKEIAGRCSKETELSGESNPAQDHDRAGDPKLTVCRSQFPLIS
jgi:hypothetical protein